MRWVWPQPISAQGSSRASSVGWSVQRGVDAALQREEGVGAEAGPVPAGVNGRGRTGVRGSARHYLGDPARVQTGSVRAATQIFSPAVSLSSSQAPPLCGPGCAGRGMARLSSLFRRVSSPSVCLSLCPHSARVPVGCMCPESAFRWSLAGEMARRGCALAGGARAGGGRGSPLSPPIIPTSYGGHLCH